MMSYALHPEVKLNLPVPFVGIQQDPCFCKPL